MDQCQLFKVGLDLDFEALQYIFRVELVILY